MIGVVLDRPAAGLLAILRKKGLIALSAGETVLRLVPPLTVTRAECEKALKIIETGLKELNKESK
jgi:acetylornithine aminotransferase